MESVKDSIANLIVSKVRDDIEEWKQFLFYPPDYEDVIGDAFASVEKKIKKMYQDAALEVAQNAVDRFKQQCMKCAECSEKEE